jgi:peroxiredoxin
MARTETPVCEFGLPAPDFNLPGVDGKHWSLESIKGERGLLVMFICNHCPYVQAIREHLVTTASQLKAIGVNVIAIMSNDPTDYPEDSFDNMKKIAEQYRFPFPYVSDATQDVAKRYGAVCTPDFFGYNADLKLQYRGRLDESRKETVTGARNELYDAMKLIADTGQGPKEQVPSMGCSIKWKAAVESNG